MSEPSMADVVIVGGGPAGASAACVLAQAGLDVVLLEREPGSRYHVGESLLPYCYPMLERIRALEAIRDSAFQEKKSVQFIRADGSPSQPFYFASHLESEAATTWQVDRARFDALLLSQAREAGATVLQGLEATELLEEAGVVTGVVAQSPDGARRTFSAPWTLDASGRDGLSMRVRRWRVSEPQLDRVAVWGYFDGAVRGEGADEGATTIAALPDGGWVWVLPLANDLTSVGVVARVDEYAGDLQNRAAAFYATAKRQPWVEARLAPSRLTGDFRITRNYSYYGRHAGAPGLLLCGDAFAFLDPVFSSGVYIALTSGVRAADAILATRTNDERPAETVSGYTRWLTERIEPMRRLIYAFYDPAFSVGALVRERPDLRGDITDILVGNLGRSFAPLMEALGERTAPPRPLAQLVGQATDTGGA